MHQFQTWRLGLHIQSYQSEDFEEQKRDYATFGGFADLLHFHFPLTTAKHLPLHHNCMYEL